MHEETWKKGRPQQDPLGHLGRGNYEQVKEGENTFSSGADASALRLLIVAASRFQWEAGTIDIKTAFLNASMSEYET